MSLLHAVGSDGADGKFDVDDVFSTYLYTGNGSTQTINNGIDLAGKGGLVWIKGRSQTSTHSLRDSVRGVNQDLATNYTSGQYATGGITAFNSNGFTIGSYFDNQNYSGMFIASWTFRKAPKFFDIVTYTGDGSAPRAISHALGVRPGMVVIKKTSGTSNWHVTHRSAPNQGAAYPSIGGNLYLNAADAADIGTNPALSAMDATTFTLSTNQNATFNVSGQTYVAYLFAHDPSADGIIQCGSYIGNGSATGPVISLGWEPQYLMIKNASGTGNWQIIDNMRGMPVGSADATLQANLGNAESSVDYVSPTATGFQITSTSSEVNTSGSSYIYMAIRRSNKVPTSGSEVYNAIAATASTSTSRTVGFTADLLLSKTRTLSDPFVWADRLRGFANSVSTGAAPHLVSSSSVAETLNNTPTAYNVWNNTFLDGPYASTLPNVWHVFRRAPGFFDVVCYTGTGVARTVAHGLGVVPELIIVKSRTIAQPWAIFHSSFNAGQSVALNTTAAIGNTGYFEVLPTSLVFNVSAGSAVNGSSYTYTAYLFASCPGVSKVGEYTGNGSSQIIPCGFTTGARFVLIKCTDSTGDWYMWDTVRGIVASNDPHLSLNSTAAEVTTDDSIDPEAGGFIVNQNTATNINVLDGTYIFLAIA